MTVDAPTTAIPARSGYFLGWRILVLAMITGAMTGPGQTIGVSVFVEPMMATLGLSRSELATAYLIGTLAGALALIPVGRRIDRVGARRAMLWIGLAFGIGLVFMSGVRGFVTLAVGFTLIRWLGQGSLSLVSTLSITPWFERRRGTVFGISTTVTAMLFSLSPILLGLAIEAFDWRAAWIFAAAAVWLVVLPIARFGIIDRPADVGQLPDGDTAADQDDTRIRAAASSSRREALGQLRFWLLSSAVAVTAMLGTGLMFHQVSILSSQGLTLTEAAAMFLPLVIGSVVAGLAVGALSDRVQARYLVAFSMFLLTLALFQVSTIAPGWQMIVYALTLGAASGAVHPLVATLLPRWYGLDHIGAIQGVSFMLTVAASAAGPVALSLANDALGGYGAAALLFVLAPAIIGLAGLAITEPPRASRAPDIDAPPPIGGGPPLAG